MGTTGGEIAISDRARELLCHAVRSLDAAVTSWDADSEAALDDVLAARLLIRTMLSQ